MEVVSSLLAVACVMRSQALEYAFKGGEQVVKAVLPKPTPSKT